MAENGSGCCVGDLTTFDDIVRTEALSAYLEWCPDILTDTPLLDALHERVSNDPGIARYLRSAQRYPKAAHLSNCCSYNPTASTTVPYVPPKQVRVCGLVSNRDF